jgi:hypothetical protein
MIARIGVLLGLLLVLQLASAQERPHSVCEVLTSLEQYSGKLITIRGYVRSSVDTWLAAENCKTVIEVDGVSFDNLVSIQWPDPSIVNDILKGTTFRGATLPFGIDGPSLDRIRAALRQRDRRSQDIYATVEGLFITRNPPLALVVKRGGVAAPIGFGHLGAAPALIIVKRISDVAIVRRE